MHSQSTPRILITPGEPAGVGVDVTLQISTEYNPCELVVVADPNLLLERAKLLNIPLELEEVDLENPPAAHLKNTLKILPVKLKVNAVPGKLNSANSPYVIECLQTAVDLCLQKKADALVTGPVQKNIINDAGIAFSGHTEFLAEHCKVQQSIMLFVVDDLKVALLTTHIPLAKVSEKISAEKFEATLRLLKKEMQNKFNIANPRIAICGLNPHAGEEGLLGREEIDIMQPVIEKLRKEKFSLTGPLSADTIFNQKIIKSTDVILAMYHDQALPVIKYMGFDRAVNVTLGLPIIRTSVDHGTALDIAGSGSADAGSMRAAINLAITLAHPIVPKSTH